MPPSLDTFDRIVCINLDDRPDRWEQTRQCITPLLDEKTLERFAAIKPDLALDPVHNGRAGCLLSHRQVIEEAYRDGLDSVLVLEDDLWVDPAFETSIQPTLQTLGQKDWDLFYLGVTPNAPLLPAGKGLVRTFGGMTTHAIAYHRRAMPELLKQLPDESGVLRFLSRYKSIDRYYRQQYAPRRQCYAASPMLIFQRDGFSDIQQEQTPANREEAQQAFERYLIETPALLQRIKLHASLRAKHLKYCIDGTRRAIFRQIKPKPSSR